MRSLGRVVLIAFLCVVAIRAHASDSEDAGRLVGIWHEYDPGDNLISFTADGHVMMYLRKGEISDLHTLDGQWSVKDGELVVTFSALGKSVSQSSRLSFEGDEMILTDEKGEKTRHRRHAGRLPEWTQW
jgi:uncharacterized protein (TIGR03066 family)